MNKAFKTYNITGRNVKVKLNNSCDASTWGSVWLPAKIIAEYPKFLIAEILEHRNPRGQGMSWPYRITLNKVDLYFKDVELKLT